eukprot:TRINITY_DN1357_c4_g1_i13.p1 TRINITY_DN1357_c4_g1~~TRINITY_DN1357_c4_g1_i13.p1  ORF type:complete len:1025 (+),score=163.68 TRINITY_DN1357_c4_g1_i13:235-3309(+)
MGCAPSVMKGGPNNSVGREEQAGAHNSDQDKKSAGSDTYEDDNRATRNATVNSDGSLTINGFSKYEKDSDSYIYKPSVGKSDGGMTLGKERRQPFGDKGVREDIRMMAQGRAKGMEEQSGEVSESEDEDEDDFTTDGMTSSGEVAWKSTELRTEIRDALATNFIFKGISSDILERVVERMFEVDYKEGATIIQQGASATEEDCLYYLAEGSVDIVISGASDAALRGDEESREQNNKTVVHKEKGFVFGDVALLFNSPRSASVVASTDVKLWAMDKRTFLKFVMGYAQGARTLRFVRKLPVLKGLPDNSLLGWAERMKENVYQSGDFLIKYGESGQELFLIRYGKVRVLRPTSDGGRVEVAVLGRGQFVGERTMITGKLRSADCVAAGSVRAIVINKKEFMQLDNPILQWMMDYDAASTVIKGLSQLQQLRSDQLEEILDKFDDLVVNFAGQSVIREGEPLEHIFVLKSGELMLTKSGSPIDSKDYLHKHFLNEIGGYTYFGDACLRSIQPCPVTVTVASESAQILKLRRKHLDSFIGPAAGAMSLTHQDISILLRVLKVLESTKSLQHDQLKALARGFHMRIYNPGDVVAHGSSPDRMCLIREGECVLTSQVRDSKVSKVDLKSLDASEFVYVDEGNIYAESALSSGDPVHASLVAYRANTKVLLLKRDHLERILGNKLTIIQKARLVATNSIGSSQDRQNRQIRFKDLEMHRVIGTGQFGLVRVVRHKPTGEVYALKIMHKAPIQDAKQVEHIINERIILSDLESPFCVKLIRAMQDKNSLFLLLEWVGGGELFHHLDIQGQFTEDTARFYTANVLLALEWMHERGIIYRDLKPENLLLDKYGYIKVTDFGFAKKINKDKTFTICGTPDYQAPEVIMKRGTDKSADYWALGVLIFEMLVGDPPFKSMNGSQDPWDTFRKILSGRFYVPDFISREAEDLIYRLLQVKPEKRLGAGAGGTQDIKNHQWFNGLDWKALSRREILSPFRPHLTSPIDTQHFEEFDDVAPPPNRKRDQNVWELWDWID